MPASGNKSMVIRLTGQMMSWRLAGRKNTKMTCEFTTKSGIVGLIGSSLGMDRHDRAQIAEIASLKMVSYRLSQKSSLLKDFHTVGCRGLNDKGTNESVPKKVNGDRKQIVTNRYYLVDDYFIVILTGPGEIVDRYMAAIRSPAHPLFLGTKCSLPSERLDIGVYETEEKAEEVMEVEARSRGMRFLHKVSDVDDVTDANDTIMDFPYEFGLSFGGYGRRPIRSSIVDLDL